MTVMKKYILLIITFMIFSCSRHEENIENPPNDNNNITNDYGNNNNIPELDGPKLVNNPIIENLGVCDPHIHIFGNKAYLFASHDRMPGHNQYGMYDWWVWSSEDLVHWEMEYNLFPTDMWTGPTKNCWATDGAERNGKYYLYVSGNWNLGIAVSENSPKGPYVDALGKGLNIGYDPTVYIDDDSGKTPYLIIDKFPYKIARLNEDMISLAETPKDLIHETTAWEGDGGFLHKHNGIYYLNGHGPHYCTSNNIYGPYKYRGTAYKHWVDHPTFFTWHNQTYCAFGLADTDNFFRKTHISYVHYKDNGEMVICEDTGDSFIGVGQYDCSEKIQAENFFAASDEVYKKETETGFAVSGLENTSYIYFQRILNLSDNAEFIISATCNSDNGTLEVRQNTETGDLLGTLHLNNTNNSFEEFKCQLNNNEGLNNIYIVYKGDGRAEIDWIKLTDTGKIERPEKGEAIIIQHGPDENTVPQKPTDVIEAEDLMCYYELQTTDANDPQDKGGNKCLGFLKNGSSFSYLINFGKDKFTKFKIRVAAPAGNSKLEMRLNTEDGELLETFTIAQTGGWSSWQTQEFKITNSPEGVQHIFFIVIGDGEDYKYNVNWISFSK